MFAPVREHGLQNAIESFNGQWQGKVWARFEHQSREGLRQQSDRSSEAKIVRSAARRDGAPERREFPAQWEFDAKQKVRGRIIYIRRTNEQGEASILGHQFAVDERWIHRLVRGEVEIDATVIRFYALRRSAPDQQPMSARLFINCLSDTSKTDPQALALVIDSSFRWHGGACTCPLIR